MKHHSIKFKIAILLSIIILVLIIAVIFINSTFSQQFYLKNKQKNMLEVYNEFDKLTLSYNNGEIDIEYMNDKLEQLTNNSGMLAIVVSSDWKTVYTNTKVENEMIDRLRKSMLSPGWLEELDNDTGINGESAPSNQEQESLNEGNKADTKPNGGVTITRPDKDKNHLDGFEIFSTNTFEEREIILKDTNYTIQMVYDDRLLDNYLELWGNLDSGEFIMLRVGIQSIKDNIEIANKFIKIIGIIVFLFGLIISYFFSSYIAKPIKQISDIAERMSNMDFDARYEGHSKDEIGALGASMNHMSEKLEENITQLKHANLELKHDIDQKEKLELMRQDFISNVSHELKTPIALIQGYAEGLKDGITDDPDSMNFYCDVIIDEANKMNQMVKKLLTLNQLESGGEELVVERFDIVAIIKSVISSNSLRAEANGCSIEFKCDYESCYVWSDQYKIDEVITNYLSNAINHCEFEKKIIVSLVKKDDNVRVTVFNTGQHIPEDSLDKVWGKFYKVDKARTREYGGNGIGLSIVKAIMDSYGKEYGVRNVESGVEFWFDVDAKV